MAKEAHVGRMQVYGRRLRQAREAAGTSQADVASAIGCGQPFVSKVEAGDMMLRPYDYAIVARLLGADLEALIGELTPEEHAEAEGYVADAIEAGRAWHDGEFD